MLHMWDKKSIYEISLHITDNITIKYYFLQKETLDREVCYTIYKMWQFEFFPERWQAAHFYIFGISLTISSREA